MKKEVISGMQGISLLFLLLSAVGVVNMTGAGNINQDFWISIIISSILVIPLFLMYCRLNKLFPGQNFFDILELVFGKIGGKILSVIFIWYGLHTGAMVLNHTASFMQISTMPETPLFIIIIIIAVVCIISLKSGIEVIARCAQIFFWVVLLSIVAVFLLSLGEMKPENLMPVLYDGWGPVFNGVFIITMLPFGQVIVFSVILHCVKPSYSAKKVMFIGEALFVVTYLFVIIKNIMIIGMDNIKILLYPSFAAASVINIGGFLRSVEIFVAVYYLLNTLFLTIISLFFAAKGIQKLFNLASYRKIAAPTVLISTALLFTMFENYGDVSSFLSIYSIYMIPFQIILPIIIYIFAEIKAKKMCSIP